MLDLNPVDTLLLGLVLGGLLTLVGIYLAAHHARQFGAHMVQLWRWLGRQFSLNDKRPGPILLTLLLGLLGLLAANVL